MADALGYRLKDPCHPGLFLKSEVIEPMGLSITQAAAILGITRPALSNFLNAHSSLSANMAIRIQQAFGLRLETMMRMQNSYDIAQALKCKSQIKLKRYMGKVLEGYDEAA
jgi:antitoxin HigA-1